MDPKELAWMHGLCRWRGREVVLFVKSGDMSEGGCKISSLGVIFHLLSSTLYQPS